MNNERLKMLISLAHAVGGLENRLANHRASPIYGGLGDYTSPRPEVCVKVNRLIEQDLEEQLALAKAEFEAAN